MEKQSLPTDVKRRLHLRGVAEAWLKWPWAYDRELAAAGQALDEGEEVGGVFDVHPGRWTIHSGLLFVTDRRLLYVAYRWCRQSVLSVEFETIVQAVILPDGKDQDLVIETATGERLYFRSGRGRMKYFSPLFDLLGARLGARLIREGELPAGAAQA